MKKENKIVRSLMSSIVFLSVSTGISVTHFINLILENDTTALFFIKVIYPVFLLFFLLINRIERQGKKNGEKIREGVFYSKKVKKLARIWWFLFILEFSFFKFLENSYLYSWWIFFSSIAILLVVPSVIEIIRQFRNLR